jgi:tellurium resistance protein TerD
MGIELGGTTRPTTQLGGGLNLGRTPDTSGLTPASTSGLALRKVEAGERISLTKGAGSNPNLDHLLAGLSWDVSTVPGEKFDLDVSVIAVDENGKTSIGNFVCYDERFHVTQDGAIKYHGDNQTGEGEGYDEKVEFFLSRMSPATKKAIIYVHIYDAVNRKQNFGKVSNASITLEDMQGVMQPIRFDLTEDYSTFTAIRVAEVYRHGDEWKLNPIGVGLKESLEDTLRRYGINA